MEEILDIFKSEVMDLEIVEQVQNATVTALQYLKFLGILILGVLLVSSLSRFLLGKKSQINQAITSAIEIFFLYVISAVIYALGLQLQIFLKPLPFVAMVEDYMVIFPVLNADLLTICGQVLNLLIIAFLVNLVNGLIPRGKHVITWFLLRFLTVILSVAMIYGADMLLNMYVPQDITEHAPVILLGALLLLILLGSLKVPVGGAIAFLNPILAVLYTFFFSNIIGRALSKALLTTALLTGLVAALNALDIYAVHIAPSVLTAYIPLLLIVLALWYVVGHLFTKEK